MLHIVTPCFRNDKLQEIYNSIPKSAEIKWHIAKSVSREDIQKPDLIRDKNVIIYNVDCADSDTASKRNAIFENLKQGYFYLLDDDTIFLANAFDVYKKYHNNKKLIFGHQKYGNNRIFIKKCNLKSSNFLENDIDTGMGLASVDVLKNIKWEFVKFGGNDVNFWTKIYAEVGKEHTVFSNEIVSYNNYFGPKIRVWQNFKLFTFQTEIYNPIIVFVYIRLYVLKSWYHKWFKVKKENKFQKSKLVKI